jgi:NitT/TauT family transport system substrate-binding protein
MFHRRSLISCLLLLLVLSLGFGAATVTAQDADPCPINPAVTFTWVSPRGTLEVMDDYPLWVATELGYFEDLGIAIQLEPGPIGGANVLALLTEGQADVSFPSPGVLAAAIDAGIPLTLGFELSAGQVFDFAVPAGSDIKTVADLEGKTISLGSAGWSPVVDPILAEAGVDPSTVTYVEAGAQWGQVVAQGGADAALAWEGLRAQWDAIGLDFDYLIGMEFSNDPSNGYAVRSSDLTDPAKSAALTCFFRGVAMALEFSRLNPQAAAQITYEKFPALRDQMTPDLALESMRQLMFLYNQPNKAGNGYGYSDLENWDSYLGRISDLGQTTQRLDVNVVVTNQFVEAANDFDHDAVAADAEGYAVSDDWAAVELQGPVE